jgi:hypothetical protein
VFKSLQEIKDIEVLAKPEIARFGFITNAVVKPENRTAETRIKKVLRVFFPITKDY